MEAAKVTRRKFPNRSREIQDAVREKLERIERSRLARECAKLDRVTEQMGSRIDATRSGSARGS